MDSDNDSTQKMRALENSGAGRNPIQDSIPEVKLRLAVETDLGAINDIYNYYVLNSTCTYQEIPETVSDRLKWFHRHGGKHPVIVAELGDKVVGWGSLSPYHLRSAYQHTVENSVYVHHHWHRHGIGSILLRELIRRSRDLGHRAIIAAIDSDQTHSIRLHAKCDFQHAGRLRNVGLKFGRWLDVVYMELLL
jgi:L-amino acid N-acyltransferase